MNLFFHYVVKAALVLAWVAVWQPESGKSQSTSCFWLEMPVLTAQAGDTVCLPVLARGYTDLAAMQFEVGWDTAMLEYVSIDLSSSQLTPVTLNFNFGLNGVDSGKLQFLWYDASTEGQTVTGSAQLFSLCLKVRAAGQTYTPLHIGAGTTLNFEVVNADGQLLHRAVQQGGIWSGGSGDVPRFADVCIAIAACGQSSGAITPSVAGGTPPYSYQWNGPGNFVSTSATLGNLSGGDYTLTLTDAAGAVLYGQFSVPATPSPVQVKTEVTRAFCGLPNGCVRLNVSGGLPPYTYQWSDGTGGVPERCDLSPGPFGVTVSDANGCLRQRADFMPDDSLLHVEHVVQHINACNGAGSAAITPLNGMPPYRYAWPNGDTSASATGLAAGLYTVTVTAGGGCSTVRSFPVIDYSIHYWNLQLVKTCPAPDSINGKLTLQFNKNGGIDFPAIVSWSDGTTRLIPEKPADGILDSLVGVPSGAYSVMVTDTGGCRKMAAAVLNCLAWQPIADTFPGFYIRDDYLNPQYDLDSCAGIYARDFNGIRALDLSLSWSNGFMQLRGLRQFGLPGLKSDDFVFSPDSTGLGLQWAAPGGHPVTLPGPVLLFEACFTPRSGSTTYGPLEFDDTPLVPRVLDSAGVDRGFAGLAGEVLFKWYFPAGPSICDFGIAPPSCASDGYGRIWLEPCKFDRALNGGYSFDGGNYTNSLEGLLFADSGVYKISANQPGKSSSRLLARVPWAAQGSPGCVWPGDADDNNAVNHYDLLYLGLGLNAAGPPRPDAGIEWTGQEAPAWIQHTGARQVNFKNIDTNGDGFIDAADTMAITRNWGRVVNLGKDDPFATSLSNPDQPLFPAFRLQADTLVPGQTASLPLSLGAADAPVDSVLGLAFSISYDPAVVKANVVFAPSHSWLGNPATELLWIQRNFPAQGRVDVAITRTDGQPVSGAGLIGDMIIVIEDNIFIKNDGEDDPTDSTRRTLLFFSGLRAVGAGEDGSRLAGAPVELFIRRQTTGTNAPQAWQQPVYLSPNPAGEHLRVWSPAAAILHAEIWDAGGKLHPVQAGGSTALEIPCSSLTPGVYFIRIFTDQGVSVQRFTISR